ncbi:hypothetical protein Emed_001210 [Eimeria media]
MGGRNRNKKAQAILLGSNNNTYQQQYQQQRYATRAQPKHRQRQQQRTRNRQQFPHPEAYYLQQRSNEGQNYPKHETYQGHQQYSNHQIHQSQHSFRAHETYQDQGSYEVQHSFHEQLVVHQQQQAHQGYPSGQVHGTAQSYHTQQSYYVQQCYYAQDPADPHKIYQSQHTLKGSRQLHFNAGGNEAYNKNHKFSRQYNHSVKKRTHYQSHDAPTRLDSKASTAATADGNENGTAPAKLPWTWCDFLEVTNSAKYVNKHKGGEGLVFQRQAEAAPRKPKPSPDELDIWVNVGTEQPHIWGGKEAEDSQDAEDEEEEMNAWALRLFGDETAQSQAHSLRIIHSHW